jgi:Cell wall-associated hydrolases (invasion-associated proteins)
MWGGMTRWGIDCSGLTKLFYRLQGIHLPHLAAAQSLIGQDISFIEEAKEGDLCFFGDDIIHHVGLYIGNSRLLHASSVSGCVTTDLIDNYGISNKTTKQYTHTLKRIKRLMK